MSAFSAKSGLTKLPQGYAAIPIAEEQKAASLKICVLARREADPVGGHLVVLHDTVDAKVFLGCIVDMAGRIHEWLEIWIQNSQGLINTAWASRQLLSNAMLDERWRRQLQAFEQLDAGVIVKTGWESAHPLPTFLDLSASCAVHPVADNSAARWQLCTDEGLLAQKGLPGYGTSLHRYLYVPASGADSQFVPVTPGAPTNACTKALSEICGDPARIIALNPQAGFILVKKHAPIGLEAFIDILSGAGWDGLKHGRSVLDLGEQFSALRKDETALIRDGRLFLETHGRYDRLLETFHLKLRLLADIVSSVHSVVRHLQRPLLNINPDNWHIKLGEPGHGLPFLWTARAVLGDPGDAIPLAIEKSDLQYYLPALAAGTSIYRPVVTSLPAKGRASIRIRQVSADSANTTLVEGTFSTHERIEMARHDLVWFRLNLASGDINLYAHLEADSAMAHGEWRFRTVAQTMNDKEVSDLRAAEGVPMPDVPFEVVPLLSSPCDLYSLAVMAIRILLVDDTTTLAVALDETLSLLRQISAGYDGSKSLENCVSDIFGGDKRWLESLGPQHLTFDELTSEEAFVIIPLELWSAVLAVILRMFPGPGPESQCKDYGDAQPGGLHKVFERTICDLDKLILRTRSMIVPDWQANQEISAVIQKYLT
ncbi:MAG TPA: hypothetical protein VMW16_10025 [Sedimentisphaerales bacterium]|nr:hypothetical protein [Sedimentisphaerales bacterium]